MSVSQGKLAADKSVIRYLPSLAASTGLRKVAIQRLLENEEHHAWTPEELDAWRQAGGWIHESDEQQRHPRLAISIRALGQAIDEREAPVFGRLTG
jgi:hypothetical protein